MAAPLPTQEQVCAEVGELLARALGRLTAAEAAGTLTPREAVVVARIRARMAAESVPQQSAAA